MNLMLNKNNTGMSLADLKKLKTKDQFAELMGAEISKYATGDIEVTIAIKQSMTQHDGFVHGAVLGFMVDTTIAWAAASVLGSVLTSEYKINLLSPAVGELLLSRGVVIHTSNRHVICQSDVFVQLSNGKKKMVATALGTVNKFKT